MSFSWPITHLCITFGTIKAKPLFSTVGSQNAIDFDENRNRSKWLWWKAYANSYQVAITVSPQTIDIEIYNIVALYPLLLYIRNVFVSKLYHNQINIIAFENQRNGSFLFRIIYLFLSIEYFLSRYGHVMPFHATLSRVPCGACLCILHHG